MSKSSQQTTFNKQEAMLRALHATYGAVSKAAAIVQITPQTHYNWYKNDDEYRKQVDNIKYESFEEYKDLVMEAVMKKLKDGNTAVINRCMQILFSKWNEEMQRTNPYRQRLMAKIKYVDKPSHE